MRIPLMINYLIEDITNDEWKWCCNLKTNVLEIKLEFAMLEIVSKKSTSFDTKSKSFKNLKITGIITGAQ